jgi:hypothetical protein
MKEISNPVESMTRIISLTNYATIFSLLNFFSTFFYLRFKKKKKQFHHLLSMMYFIYLFNLKQKQKT